AGEGGVDRLDRGHAGRARRRRRAARSARDARRLVHQHGALELGRRGSLEIEAALRAGGRSLRVLRPTVRTEHAAPPPALAGSSAQARYARLTKSGARVLECRAVSQDRTGAPLPQRWQPCGSGAAARLLARRTPRLLWKSMGQKEMEGRDG